jgi:hypothetical protein
VSEESKRGVAFISSLVSCWHFCFFVCKAVDEFLISVCYNYLSFALKKIKNSLNPITIMGLRLFAFCTEM